jgi:hypothetical protein
MLTGALATLTGAGQQNHQGSASEDHEVGSGIERLHHSL